MNGFVIENTRHTKLTDYEIDTKLNIEKVICWSVFIYDEPPS